MKFTFFQIAIIALQQTIKVAAAAAADFTTIGGDFENVSSVNINMPCSGLRNIPKTMFTIQPSDSADVKTFPPKLVIASISDAGSLSFTWNPEVASTASEGGVLIELPAKNIQSVFVSSQNTAQILDGFTYLNDLSVQGQSTLTATFNTATTPNLVVSDQSTVNMLTTGGTYTVSVDQQSDVNLQTSTPVKSFQVANQSNLNVNGGVVTGTVTQQSGLKVTGDVSSSVSVTEQSSIMADTISGEVTISSQSDASASSCDNVSASDQSDCSVTGPPSVNVDVSEQSLTRTGTSLCISGSSSTTVSSVVVAAVGSLAAIYAFSLM